MHAAVGTKENLRRESMRFAAPANNCPVGNLASSCEGVEYRWKLIVYRVISIPQVSFPFLNRSLKGWYHCRHLLSRSIIGTGKKFRFLLIGGFKNADKVPEEPLHGTDIDDGVSAFPDEMVYFLLFMSSGFWRISSKSVPNTRDRGGKTDLFRHIHSVPPNRMLLSSWISYERVHETLSALRD